MENDNDFVDVEIYISQFLTQLYKNASFLWSQSHHELFIGTVTVLPLHSQDEHKLHSVVDVLPCTCWLCRHRVLYTQNGLPLTTLLEVVVDRFRALQSPPFEFHGPSGALRDPYPLPPADED